MATTTPRRLARSDTACGAVELRSHRQQPDRSIRASDPVGDQTGVWKTHIRGLMRAAFSDAEKWTFQMNADRPRADKGCLHQSGQSLHGSRENLDGAETVVGRKEVVP
jgi:hypothetical protein